MGTKSEAKKAMIASFIAICTPSCPFDLSRSFYPHVRSLGDRFLVKIAFASLYCTYSVLHHGRTYVCKAVDPLLLQCE